MHVPQREFEHAECGRQQGRHDRELGGDREKPLPGRRQLRDAGRVPHDEVDAQVVFESLQALRHRRDRHPQHGRGMAEVPLLSHRDETLDGREVERHVVGRSSGSMRRPTTSSSIDAVSRPVKVFCWLTW